MCHRLDLRERARTLDRTLAPADLLLSKLQVVNTNEKDYKDAIAVLADHEVTGDDTGININRLNELCASDWGWWRTVTMVAEKTHKVALQLAQQPDGAELAHVPDRIRARARRARAGAEVASLEDARASRRPGPLARRPRGRRARLMSAESVATTRYARSRARSSGRGGDPRRGGDGDARGAAAGAAGDRARRRAAAWSTSTATSTSTTCSASARCCSATARRR